MYAVDIAPESIQATVNNFQRLIGESSRTQLQTFVSDLLSDLPDNIQAEVITFNPPSIDVTYSDDPDVLRAVCAGPDVITRLFAQIKVKSALAGDGELIITVSNTSDLRAIVSSGYEQGFIPSVLSLHTWPEPYHRIKTHVFSFRQSKSQSRPRTE